MKLIKKLYYIETINSDDIFAGEDVDADLGREVTLMDKINELIDEVNKLKKHE